MERIAKTESKNKKKVRFRANKSKLLHSAHRAHPHTDGMQAEIEWKNTLPMSLEVGINENLSQVLAENKQ